MFLIFVTSINITIEQKADASVRGDLAPEVARIMPLLSNAPREN